MRNPLAAFLLLPLFAATLGAAGTADEIAWFQGSWDKALAEAGTRNVPVFAYFWSNGNDECVRLYGETMKDASCIGRLRGYLCFSADTGQPDGKRLAEHFHVERLPTMLILAPDGSPVDALLGFHSVQRFAAELDRIQRGSGTLPDLRKRAAAKPRDLGLALRYAEVLRRIGDRKGWEDIVGSIRKRDPKGRTLVGARIHLQDLEDAIRKAASDDHQPLIAFLKRTSHKGIRWEGWHWVGWREFDLQNLEAARQAFQFAWKYCPKDRVLAFGQRLATAYWEIRSKLKTADKKFLVLVGKAQAARAEKLRNVAAADRPESARGDFDAFLAGRLDVLACCYYMAGRRKLALATAGRCLGLDPKNSAYRKRLEMIKEGK